MAKKPKFYAVVHGRKIGIFNSWEGGARLSIDRFPEAKHYYDRNPHHQSIQACSPIIFS